MKDKNISSSPLCVKAHIYRKDTEIIHQVHFEICVVLIKKGDLMDGGTLKVVLTTYKILCKVKLEILTMQHRLRLKTHSII